jgi:calcineurin-like phosphoesterase family protein
MECLRLNNYWYTSDHHFGHKNIIALNSRPFTSVEEMDEALIARWNSVVGPDDVVYHLGDFSFGPQAHYLPRLNGEKHLVLGNHDPSLVSAGWASINDMLHVTTSDGTRLVLCHYAMRVWSKSHYGAIHLYGHSHGSLAGDSQSCDVGVDCWGFEPVSLDAIKARMSEHMPRFEPDHHLTVR